MGRSNGLFLGNISDRARNSCKACHGPAGEVHPLRESNQSVGRIMAQLKFPKRWSALAIALALPPRSELSRAHDSFGKLSGRSPLFPFDDGCCIWPCDGEHHINAVGQRSAKFFLVPLDTGGRTGTRPVRVAVVAARTGVACGEEHEASRKPVRSFSADNAHAPLLKRLTQRL